MNKPFLKSLYSFLLATVCIIIPFTFFGCGSGNEEEEEERETEVPSTDNPTGNNAKYGYRVKKITRYHLDGADFNDFTYDRQGRISSYTHGGTKTEYDYSGRYLTLKMWNNDLVTCELNGQLVTGYNWMKNGSNQYCRIAHNSQKKPTELNMPLEGHFKLSYQSYGFTIDVTDNNRKWNYTYSREKNDMNIDLNPFLMKVFNGFGYNSLALVALLPTDYIGRVDYLVIEQSPSPYAHNVENFKVTRDNNNLIKKISFDMIYYDKSTIDRSEVLDIEYEKYEIK